MKKLLLPAALLLSLGHPAQAQAQAQAQEPPPQGPAAVQQDPVKEQIDYLGKTWAKIKYQIPGKDEKLDAIHKLEEHAAQVTAAYPDHAEPKIWEGVILSTDAGIVKGLSALGKVKKARMLFEEAIKEDPNAVDGGAYTSLGSLYYQVPGWPIGFGDDKQAEKYLKLGLQVSPDGIDSNFFYGDFLLQDDRYSEAKTYFERALKAPDRPGRALADAGRRQEIKAKLTEMSDHL